MNLNFEDFYKVPDLSFDVEKLRVDLEGVLKKKNFNTLGIKNFGAISLNQIPNDESSITGNKVRGVYWTKPDETGKGRALGVNEVKFTGEVLENVKMATYEINMKRILKKEGATVGLADGTLSADGKIIYKAGNLKVGLFKQ